MATEVINREELINKIWQARGRVALVAESFGVTTQTIYNYAERYATVKTAIEQAQLHGDVLRVDTAETKLDKAVLNGERWAILNTLDKSPEAKRRGWGTKTQVEHSVPIDTPITIVKENRNAG
jgi:hypothetical protein